MDTHTAFEFHQESGYTRIYWVLVIGVIVLSYLILDRPELARAGGDQQARIKKDLYSPPRATGEDRWLSPFWGADIQQWGDYIFTLSDVYGFHPDLIAAIIAHESSQADHSTNGGAIGLMEIMPSAGGANQQPASQEFVTPENNLRWGMAILSYVVQQSGGDLFTALAAYNGGWGHVGNQTAREYAAGVLDSYARALVAREGLSPDIAAGWTVAVEIRAGNVPTEPMLVLGDKPYVGMRTLAEHTVYAFADKKGNTYYVRGYVVPLGLSGVFQANTGTVESDQLEAPLRARLGEKSARATPGNPRVLLACLPSLSRLRGQLTTRWYSPSQCPETER